MESRSQDSYITLDIVRESGQGADWLNRFCRDPETGEILYYCTVAPGSVLTIHKGSAKGAILAQVCLLTPGTTDLHFLNPLQTIELEHIENMEIPNMTRFQVDREVYFWEGRSKLVSVRTGEIVAEFRPAWTILDVKEHKLGHLILNCESGFLRDIALATALVVMERSDEARQAVISLIIALTLQIGLGREKAMEIGITSG